MTACNRSQLEQVYTDRAELGTGAAGFGYDNDAVWARENLDLQSVGELLQQADNAEELEYLLNNEDGINNLDLNGDGYVDYISVREFDDRYDDERGFSLYSMFGPDEIQEICTIIFDRNGYNDGYYYPGARVLLTGNDEIYGDNYYYETNWLDRSLPIVSWLFTERDDYYRSPYYYGYYPDYYEPYAVVETVVYQERIREYYPEPIFIQTSQPTLVEEVKVVSPYRDKTMTKVYANLAKPTRQQLEFKQKNPDVSQVAKVNREQVKNVQAARPEKQFKENRNRFDKQQNFDKQQSAKFDKPNRFEKPNKQERGNFERQNQAKVERQNEQRFEKEQRRVEQQQQRATQQQQRFEQRQQQQVQRQQQQQQRQQMRVERQQQPRFERPQQQQRQQQQQQRVERPQQQQRQEMRGGGNPNKGGGDNPNKGGGGGNPNKGGGNPNNGGGGGGKKGKG